MPTINFVSWNSWTNIISIKWGNHNGWIDIFVIKENYFFLFVFSTYLPVFLLKFHLGISCFWGSRVNQKYAMWVLVGCRIKFHIQRALSIETWVKTRGYMLKIQTKNSFFMTNMSIQPLWLTHFIETLLVPEFQLTKFIVGTISYKAHFRPQISSNAR